jgi:hypothetical protein
VTRAKTNDVMMTWPCVALLLLSTACGDDGGGGGSGGGTDGAGTGGEASEGDGGEGADDESGDMEPLPDEDGDQCGDDIRGWQTDCLVQDVTAWAGDKGEIPGAPWAGDGTGRTLCCEGNPSVATADGGCNGICLLEVCEAAKIDHMNRCESCGPFDCGFDMSKCLDGGAHTQAVLCGMPVQWPYAYTLTASCSAVNNENRNPDGSFWFLQDPNDTEDDPLTCEPAAGLGYDPPRGLGQYKGSASDGTMARVTWSMGETGGEEQSDELAVLFEYAITPCAAPSNACLQLTALELTLPTTEVLGMTITNARLVVVSVTEAPIMERDDRFHFSDGSIRVLLQAHVNGFPLVLSGWNAGMPLGRLSPAGDQLSLTDLRFEFEDSVISAALEIGIQGHYDARRPNAQVTHVTAPTSCAQPVTLLATSWDDDGDPLTHSWWIKDVGTFSGPLLEVVLPAGEHDVMLTSFDPSGLFHSETLRYARRCE